MSLNGGIPAKPRLPACVDCGARGTRALRKPDAFDHPTEGTMPGGHEWLCADCEYKRDHPDFVPLPKLPQERAAKRLQKETLFDKPGEAA